MENYHFVLSIANQSLPRFAMVVAMLCGSFGVPAGAGEGRDSGILPRQATTDLITKELPAKPDYAALDGSHVRLLARGDRGSMAQFELAPGETSQAVAHRTVEEIWYFTQGRGEMWRKLADTESITKVHAGVSITIPVGTHFQFRSLGDRPLIAVAVTIPPWPGPDEAYEVPGNWRTSGEKGRSACVPILSL